MLRRRLFTLCSALSLLLCAAVCVLWVRSYVVADLVIRQDRSSRLNFYSSRGEVSLTCSRGPFPGTVWFAHSAEQPEFMPGGFGITWEEPVSYQSDFADANTVWTGHVSGVSAPCWSLVLLFLLAPTTYLIRRHRHYARTRRGLCPRCGYDLRASPGRCPECGAAAAAASSSAAAAAGPR